jgi:hypothetical protein
LRVRSPCVACLFLFFRLAPFSLYGFCSPFFLSSLFLDSAPVLLALSLPFFPVSVYPAICRVAFSSFFSPFSFCSLRFLPVFLGSHIYSFFVLFLPPGV